MFVLLTCNTAFISSRSSVGFHRPKSLVIWRGCLLFFTLLVIGAGFITIVRGGGRAVPDFATWQGHTRAQTFKSSISLMQDMLFCGNLLASCTFFFSLDEGSLPEQRTGSMTGGPFTLLEDLTRLLSTSSSSNFFLFIDLRTLFWQHLHSNSSLNIHIHTTATLHHIFWAALSNTTIYPYVDYANIQLEQ